MRENPLGTKDRSGQITGLALNNYGVEGGDPQEAASRALEEVESAMQTTATRVGKAEG